MSFSLEMISPQRLAEYAQVPSICHVQTTLEVDDIALDASGSQLAGLLREIPHAAPYTKDYDSYSHGSPLAWPRQFDLSSWAFWLARMDEQIVGATAVYTEGDIATLWDLRIAEDARRQGIARTLFRAAADWARSRGCHQLHVETQDVNVPSCRFYAAQRCYLGQIDRAAYQFSPEPDRAQIEREMKLVWYKDL